MKILYDSQNHTIRELKPNSKAHKMSRLENEIFKILLNNQFITWLELKQLTESDTFEAIHYNLKKLKKRVNIEHKKYDGNRIKDDIWII